jgi:hypothetical protein
MSPRDPILAEPVEALPAAVPDDDPEPPAAATKPVAAPVVAAVPVARVVAAPVAKPVNGVAAVAAPAEDAAPDFRAFKEKKAEAGAEGRRPAPRPAEPDTFKQVALYGGIPVAGLLLIFAFSSMFRSAPKPQKKETPKVDVAPAPVYNTGSSKPRTGKMTGEVFGDTEWMTPDQAREWEARRRK